MANRRVFADQDLTLPDLAGQDLQALIDRVEGPPEESPLTNLSNMLQRIAMQMGQNPQTPTRSLPSRRVPGADPLYTGPRL